MNARASITVTPVRVAELLAEGQRMPVYVHVIDHPDARVLAVFILIFQGGITAGSAAWAVVATHMGSFATFILAGLSTIATVAISLLAKLPDGTAEPVSRSRTCGRVSRDVSGGIVGRTHAPARTLHPRRSRSRGGGAAPRRTTAHRRAFRPSNRENSHEEEK
jgi:Transmembrane secretion effector